MRVEDAIARFEQMAQRVPYGGMERSKIDGWKHALEMIVIQRRNVRHYLNQVKRLDAYVPPHIMNSIEDSRADIRRQKRIFRDAMTKVNQVVDVDDEPGVDFDVDDPNLLA